MTAERFPEIESLLPHRPPMLFLREILDLSENSSRCLVVAGLPELQGYSEGAGVPASIGVEYMAQAAALIGGGQRAAAGESVGGGAIIAVRDIEIAESEFRIHAPLVVTAELAGAAAGASIFECKVREQGSDRQLMSGKITVVLASQGEL